ncbi:minor capsid protein [Bacillus phage Grass]|uniref:Minor capsid protein n=1 Tax=Bacillus phage Grass TaxID=1406785 RepID=U5PTQ7_BPGRA|nr:minor head protein [Bacillus phage Grass]AGY47360.1 minor capsid protein [Bacillus phage Grass]
MADVEKRKIKFRRGQEADLPTLDEGEPALTLDTNKFFIGGTNGNIQLADQKDLETLSSSVDGVKEDVSTAQTDISGLKTDVTTAKEDVSKLQTDVSTLKTDMTTAKSDISTLKSDVGTAKSDVSTLKSDMTTAKSNISSLQTDTGSLQTDVGGLKNLISSSNGAVDVGDAAMDATIKGKEKVSIAAPVLNVSSRETYHQGNFCNHAIFSGSETVTPATLAKDAYTDLTAVLDTVDSAFPAGSASAAAYTVPREGVYSFNVTVKVTTAVTATAGYIRFGLKQSRGETVTDLDIQDVHYSNAFGTPLLSATFIYKCAAGDVITPVIKPLTEDITVGTGSKCSIYFLGDSIQA